MDCPIACTALSMFYHRVRCAVQTFGLDSICKVQGVQCTPILLAFTSFKRTCRGSCLCPLDILNCTIGLSTCQEFSEKFLDFFSLAYRPAVWCSVVQFLIIIIAAISEKSSTYFKKKEIFFSGVSRV